METTPSLVIVRTYTVNHVLLLAGRKEEMKCNKNVGKSSAGQSGLKAQKDQTRGKRPALANIKTSSPTPLLPSSSASAHLSHSTVACSSCDVREFYALKHM